MWRAITRPLPVIDRWTRSDTDNPMTAGRMGANPLARLPPKCEQQGARLFGPRPFRWLRSSSAPVGRVWQRETGLRHGGPSRPSARYLRPASPVFGGAIAGAAAGIGAGGEMGAGGAGAFAKFRSDAAAMAAASAAPPGN